MPLAIMPQRLGRLLDTRLGRVALYGLSPALSVVNALVGLLLPALLGPAAFGQYSLAVTLFQYGLIFDFGVSQLIDRRVPVLLSTGPRSALDRFVSDMLWLRLYVAAATLSGGAVILAALAWSDRLAFGWGSGFLSLAAGIGFMLALGPVSVLRASSDRAGFAASNGLLMVILAIARPIGVVVDGVLGCFAALAVCYGAAAGAMQMEMRPDPAHRLRLSAVPKILAQSSPLFITSLIWAFYMTANRWVVSLDARQLELGYFAFGSNVVYLIVGSVGVLAPYYYPAMTARLATGADYCVSGRLLRDMSGLVVMMALATVIGVLIGPFFVDLLYPKFSGSGAVMRLLLVALPALSLATWLMPLALSVARRPWVQGLLVYALSLVLLMVVTRVGYIRGGIDGAAWGLSVSAVPLVGLQLAALRAGRVTRTRDAVLLFALVAACTAGIAAMVI
jgi:O-antigen/teichoic acid export membrane protein